MISAKKSIYRLNTGINKIAIIILFLNLISISPLYAQNTGYSYEHFTTKEGLSQITIRCLLQDRTGYLWIGTNDGLNRYDGYSFKTYRHRLYDKNSICNNRITSIFEDSSGLIWIGTEYGLNTYNPETEKIASFETMADDSLKILKSFIMSIFEQPEDTGKIWIATLKGIVIYDKHQQKFLNTKTDQEIMSSIRYDNNIKIYRYPGRFPMITGIKDVYIYDQETGKYSCHLLNPDPVSGNVIVNVYEAPDKPGTFMIFFNHDYFFIYDSYSQEFKKSFYKIEKPYENTRFSNFHLFNDGSFLAGGSGHLFSFDPGTMEISQAWSCNILSESRENITAILKDRSGNLWIGSELSGLYRLRAHKQFTHYKNVPGNPESLSSNEVYSILELRNEPGSFLIGTFKTGICRFDKKDAVFTDFRKKMIDYRIGHQIWTLYEDISNDLWIGVWGGLYKYDLKADIILSYRYAENKNSISDNNILSFTESPVEPGIIWIGTYKGGLNRFDKKNNLFSQYIHRSDNENSLISNSVQYLYFSPADPSILWIGTNDGLDGFDIKNNTFKHFRNDSYNQGSLSHGSVKCITEDTAGTLWVGTQGGGVNKMNPDRKTFTVYSEKDGLPNNTIYGILEDRRGFLWISTNNGLSRFDPDNETFENFSVIDGIQDMEFNTGSFCKSSSGEMLFGGIKGVTFFDPDSILNISEVSKTVITDFKLFNKSVIPGELADDRIILKKSISHTSELILSHKDKFISFEFSILDYTDPTKNRYALLMEGIHNNWQDLGTKRSFDFNLEPGRYTLRIKGANRSRNWNGSETVLKIVVTSPFWNTLWFRFILSVTVIILVLSVFVTRLSRIRNQQLILEKHKEQLEANKEQLEIHIKKQNETEKLLRESEKRYRSIIEGQTEFIVRWKKDGVWTFVNDALCKHFNFNKSEILGTSFFPIIPEESIDRIRKYVYTLTPENPSLDIGSLSDENYMKLERNGKTEYLQWSHFGIFDDDGKLIEFQSVGRDITQQKEFEFQLQKSTDELRKLSNYLQSVREEERSHIAHEIHDELGHNLTVLKMDLKLMSHSLPNDNPGITKRIEGMIDIIDSTITTVKRLSTELRPGVLDELGLNSALEWLIKELRERTNINYNIILKFNDKNLSKDFATAVFRISQEAITNAIRHSGATSVTLELNERKNHLFLKVKDNGTGINKEKTDMSKSFGLIGMRERGYAIGGKLEIEGKENKGTVLRLVSPIIRQKM